MKNYLIGIDVGTQGTKAALFDTELELVAEAFEPSRLIQPEPGTVWQEADDLYGSCARTIRELLEKSKIRPCAVAAVGLDGQMAGIMGVDADGEAVTYYDSWMDTRSGCYVRPMLDQAGESLLEYSGGPVTSNHSTKILWWKEKHPETYEKIAKFVLPHSYIAAKMTGSSSDQCVTDYTCLHFNNFSDNRNKAWNRSMLREFKVDESKLPRVVSPFELQGRVCRAFAEQSGLSEGTPVAVGCGDSAASTFGSGMFEKNMILDCAGTASILCCVVDSYVPDTRHRTMTMMRSPVDGLWLPLAYINGGGLCLTWFRDNLTGVPPASFDTLADEVKTTPPGSEGMLFCPHFSGRVLPTDTELRGAFLGLSFKHTRGHMYRAVLEGIAYEYAYYLAVIRDNYPRESFDYVATIGGGAKSEVFNQIKADVLGLRVETFSTGETALIGSAVIAAVAADVFEDFKTPIRCKLAKGDVFEPNSTLKNLYSEKSTDYLRMLESVSSVFHG